MACVDRIAITLCWILATWASIGVRSLLIIIGALGA